MRISRLTSFIILLVFVTVSSFADISRNAGQTENNDNVFLNARWLKATDTPVDNSALTTSIDIDLTIEKGNPAVIFGWTANRAYFQWQILTDSGQDIILRRCVRTFTDNPPYEDIIIPGLSPQDILGKQIHLQIEAKANSVNTYINGQKIDTYMCSRKVAVGKAGITVTPGTEISVDKFHLTLHHPNGNCREIVSEDFSGNSSLYFMDANPVDGEWHISSPTEQTFLTVDESYTVFYHYFATDKRITEATLYTSALGIYDVWINGQRVGTYNSDGTIDYDELKPGWTDYNKRVAYSCYNVTSLCQKGENSIGAIVTPGWLCGKIAREQYKYPLEMSFVARLEIKYADGSIDTIVTDETWNTEKYSHILKSDIYNGEIVDARRPLPWSEKSTIMPCKPALFDYQGKVEALQGPNVRIVKDLILHPVKTVVYSEVNKTNGYGEINASYTLTGDSQINLNYGETAIVDFGQNCAGAPLINVKGDRGTRVHLRFGEMLNDSGDSARGNDGPAGSLYTANLRHADAELYYILSGDTDGETYIPTSTYFGYRYCEITATDNIVINSLESCPFSSSHSIYGSVETDNADVNRLFNNVLWSQLSNFISVPTDCPQRDERLGWTADAMLFAPMAMYTANITKRYNI